MIRMRGLTCLLAGLGAWLAIGVTSAQAQDAAPAGPAPEEQLSARQLYAEQTWLSPAFLAKRRRQIEDGTIAINQPARPVATRPHPARSGAVRLAEATTATLQIADDFDTGTLDPTRWQTYLNQSTVQVTTGALQMNSPKITDYAYAQVTSRQKLHAAQCNVTAQVDLTRYNITGYGTAELSMNLSNLGAMMEVYTSNGQSYVAFSFNNEQGQVSRMLKMPFTAGTLKLIYHDASGEFEGLVKPAGADWISVGNSAGFDVNMIDGVSFGLTGYASGGTDQPAQLDLAFDNFLATGAGYVPPVLGEKGLFELMTFTSSQATREYRMKVPESYDPRRPIGILFGFHGGMTRGADEEPYLEHLASFGLEAKADEGYWIAVSLAMKKGDWWSGALNSTNADAIAVKTLYDLLRQHYNIDPDRIYATGHSSGGRMTLQLPYCLPDFLAASAPSVAVPLNLPPAGARLACIGSGGIRDTTWGSTATNMRTLNDWYKKNHLDADCYVFDMDHTSPPDNPSVSPARPWADEVTEYFNHHPRGYATRLFEPRAWAQAFTDEFTTGSVPVASRWRLEMFDSGGVLYGPVSDAGQPGKNVFGDRFVQSAGTLRNEPLSTSTTAIQGGFCSTRFMRRPAVWRTSFILDQPGTNPIVYPLVLTDMHGQTVMFKVQPDGWLWQKTPTRLEARANSAPTLQTLKSGALMLQTGQRYDFQAAVIQDTLVWQLARPDAGLTTGTLPLLCKDATATTESLHPDVLDGPLTFGLGLRGPGMSVSFERAELTPVIELTAEPLADPADPAHPSQALLRWKADRDLAGTALRFELRGSDGSRTSLGEAWEPDCAGEMTVPLPMLSPARTYVVRAISRWNSAYWTEAALPLPAPAQTAIAPARWTLYE